MSKASVTETNRSDKVQFTVPICVCTTVNASECVYILTRIHLLNNWPVSICTHVTKSTKGNCTYHYYYR